MKAASQQYSFSSGMLDLSVEARQDIKQYYNGAKEARNVVCLPLGGCTLRGGLRRVYEIPDPGKGVRITGFEISPTKGFLCLFTDQTLKIFLNHQIKKEMATPFKGEILRNLDFNCAQDTMIICSNASKKKKLLHKGTDIDWSLEDIVDENPPQATFIDTPGGQNEIQRLKFSSFGSGNSFRLRLEGYRTKSIFWNGSQTVTAQSIRDSLNELEIIDGKAGGVTVTIYDGSQFDVEFVGTDGKKDWEDIIIAIEDASDQARVYTKCVAEGKPPLEDLWSDTRGWPYSSCHYQGRCIYGGCTAFPNQVNGSMTNNPFCHRTSTEMLDDEAISFQADAENSITINRVFALEKLFMFSNRGIFVVPESPLTPKSYAVKHTDTACANIRPVEVDGAVVYVTQSRGGVNQSVGSVVYNYENEKYQTDDLALLAYSLMRTPVAMDVRRSSLRNNATYLFVPNADGTLAVLNTKKSQDLNGWTICDTPNGFFRDVAVVNDSAYFVVERVINGQNRWFVEEYDDDLRFDLAEILESETPKQIWDNPELAFYDGMEVGLYADGLSYGYVRVENGAIKLNYPASKIEFGLPFDWAVETLPVVAELSDGTVIGHRHRILNATLRLKDTAGIFVNGQQICNRYFGRDSWDKNEVLINGTKKINMLGWRGSNLDGLGTIRCTGTSLQPVTILSITMEVVQ